MAEAEQKSIHSSIQDKLDACVANGVPGVSAAVRTASGDEYHFQAGHANIVTRVPLDSTFAFGIGSITKVFVAVVVLQLVEDGRLRLEDTVSSILSQTEFFGNDPHAESASIEQLLNHTSGIASWEDDPTWIQDGRGKSIDPEKTWRKDETLGYVRPSASASLNVEEFSYANTNYTLLGLIIERITEKTAESEIRRRVLQPLDMQHTYFDSFEEPSAGLENKLRRYHWATPTFRETAGISPCFFTVEGRDDLVDVTNSNLSVSWTAGGMMSTPSDLLKFAAGLRDGTLLSPVSLKTLMDWHKIDEKQDIGHGVFRLQMPRPGEKAASWVGHNGGVLGFSAALWWTIDQESSASESESARCAVSILCNVGASHAGKISIPASAAHDPMRTELLELVGML